MQKLLADLNAAGVRADVLSMGMSGDMPVAVACGATHVRIGSAIFGRREPKGKTVNKTDYLDCFALFDVNGLSV